MDELSDILTIYRIVVSIWLIVVGLSCSAMITGSNGFDGNILATIIKTPL